VGQWGSGCGTVAVAVADGGCGWWWHSGRVAEWQSGRVAAWHWECGCLALAQWLLGTGRVAVALAEWHSGALGYLALKVIKSREKKKNKWREAKQQKQSFFIIKYQFWKRMPLQKKKTCFLYKISFFPFDWRKEKKYFGPFFLRERLDWLIFLFLFCFFGGEFRSFFIDFWTISMHFSIILTDFRHFMAEKHCFGPIFGEFWPILIDFDRISTILNRFQSIFSHFRPNSIDFRPFFIHFRPILIDFRPFSTSNPPQNAHFLAYFASIPVLFRPFCAIFAGNSADFKQRPDGFFRFLAVKCEIGARVFSGPPQNWLIFWGVFWPVLHRFWPIFRDFDRFWGILDHFVVKKGRRQRK
jgi:hypothetical protein